MSRTFKALVMFALVAMVIGGFAHIAKAQDLKAPAGATVYTVVNDDVPLGYNGQFNSGSVFINAVYKTKINTNSYGIGGGYFAIPRANISVGPHGDCIFIADAGGVSGSGPGDIFAYNYVTQQGTNYISNFGGNGDEYGIGLASVGNVLVAAWTDSGTLETFTIGSGCTLSKGTAIDPVGLNGGAMDGVAIAPNGSSTVQTFADGSYETVGLSGPNLGVVSGPYDSNCYNGSGPGGNLGGLPTGVAYSPDSKFAYLDCLVSIYGAVIDAFYVDTPQTTVTNGPLMALGGTAIFGSNTLGISVDGQLMDIVGTFSGSVETAVLSGTAVTDGGCATGNVSLPGFATQWVYPGTINVLGSSRSFAGGATIEEAGFGVTSAYSYVQSLLNVQGACLTILSQATNPNSTYVLSGVSFLKP